MKKSGNQPDSPFTPKSPYGVGILLAGNYLELAMAWMRASGRQNGSHPVARNRRAAERDSKPETAAQWVAWLAFFKHIGVKCVFTEKYGVITTPTEWPWQFSVDADWIEARLDNLLETYELSLRREIYGAPTKDLGHQIAESNGFPRDRRRRDWKAPPSQEPDINRYRDKPISLSPEALAIFKEATNPPGSLEDLEREVLL